MKNTNPDRRYLLWYAQRGPAVFGDWVWLTTKFLPALERFKLVATSKEDSYLISDIYYKLGDIFFFMNAPLLSLNYYEQSIEADPKFYAAYRETGCRLDEMGRYDEAESYLRKALSLCPNDESAQSDLTVILSDKQNNEEPLYKKGDKSWNIDELLANGKFTQVLSKLKKVETIEDRQRRARAYGGLDKKEEMIREWELMSTMSGTIEYQSADWFYMPDKVWNSKFFWYAIQKLEGKFVHGVTLYHDTLFQVILYPKESRLSPKQDLREHNKRIALFVQFQIARLTRDAELSKELATRYPQWTEACELNKRLNLNHSL